MYNFKSSYSYLNKFIQLFLACSYCHSFGHECPCSTEYISPSCYAIYFLNYFPLCMLFAPKERERTAVGHLARIGIVSQITR